MRTIHEHDIVKIKGQRGLCEVVDIEGLYVWITFDSCRTESKEHIKDIEIVCKFSDREDLW